MATKKVAAKKTALPAKTIAATRSSPAKKPGAAKATVQKMTKTQVIRPML